MAKSSSKPDADNANTPVTDPLSDLLRIRDIIFGPQMRDYAQRFQNVQRDLERLQQEIDRLAEQLASQDSDQGKKLQNLRRDMRQADGDLRDELRQTAQKLTTDKVDRPGFLIMLLTQGTDNGCIYSSQILVVYGAPVQLSL